MYSRIEVSVTLYWKFLNTLWSSFTGVEDNLDDNDERSVVTSRHCMSPITWNLRTAEAALISLIIWLWSGNFNFITSSQSLWHNWTQKRCLLIYSIFMGGMIYFSPQWSIGYFQGGATPLRNYSFFRALAHRSPFHPCAFNLTGTHALMGRYGVHVRHQALVHWLQNLFIKPRFCCLLIFWTVWPH